VKEKARLLQAHFFFEKKRSAMNAEELNLLTVVQLKEKARELGLSGLSKLRKAELIEAILQEVEEEIPQPVPQPVPQPILKSDQEYLKDYKRFSKDDLLDEVTNKSKLLLKYFEIVKDRLFDPQDLGLIQRCTQFYRDLCWQSFEITSDASFRGRAERAEGWLREYFARAVPDTRSEAENIVKAFCSPRTNPFLELIKYDPTKLPPLDQKVIKKNLAEQKERERARDEAYARVKGKGRKQETSEKKTERLNLEIADLRAEEQTQNQNLEKALSKFENLRISPEEVQPLRVQIKKLSAESKKRDTLEVTPDFLLRKLEEDSFVGKITTNLQALNQQKIRQYHKMATKIQKSILEDESAMAKLGEIEKSKREEMFPMMATNQVLYSKIEALIKKLLITEYTPRSVKANLLEAINNRSDGISSITGKARTFIRNFLCRQIFILSRGYASFTGTFSNMIFTGSPGVGKTKLAKAIGFVYGKMGILVNGDTIIASPKDMVGSYVGHTAPKTVGVLMKGLENVLLVDEAYQLMPCTGGELGTTGASFGNESITEIVNFLDKFVGCSVMIVAGYAKEIKNCFLGANAGLERRFPISWELPPYSSFELYEIFIKEVIRKINLSFDRETALFAYNLINQLYRDNPDVFKNQAGDMVNLAALFLEQYYGNLNYEWERSPEDKRNVIIGTLNQFLKPQGVSISV
jgi:DNA replication protein DnaC